jgi:hypothetical protein
MTTSRSVGKIHGGVMQSKAKGHEPPFVPMTPQQEEPLRLRASRIDDRVAEMMRSMFGTIDAERAKVADLDKALKEAVAVRDAALAVVKDVIPECGWADCERLATRSDPSVDPPARLCDEHRHDPAKPVEDLCWAESLRALTALQPSAAPNAAPNNEPKGEEDEVDL